jgi:predicted O-linked N-acetylglucosamine transferase (SPINDLY family)
MTPRQLNTLLQEALDLHRAGRLDEAAVRYARVRAGAPANFDAAHLAGTLELQRDRPGEAVVLLEAARSLNPKSAVCAMRLGIGLNALGKAPEAEAVLRVAAGLDPRLPEAWLHLGRALERLGRMNDAVAAVESALSAKPNHAEACDYLGALLVATRGHAAAEPYLVRAVDAQPGFARAWSNLGICRVYLGKLTDAITCFNRALALDSRLYHAYAGRGLALERCHRIADAVEDYGRAVQGNPKDWQARSARLMALHYLDGIPREELFREHAAFGAAAGPVQERPPGQGVRPLPERRLKVGFLSPNLRTHSVASFLEPLLAHLDRNAFEVTLYHDHPKIDATSDRLRGLASHWRHVAGLADASLEAVLRADGLDILVDLAGHTELNRLALLARRMAPVQATYLGYPDTTGLVAMDYRLTDATADPVGDSDLACTERLLRFAPTAWSYFPPPGAPGPSPAPCASGAAVTFGCFNNFSKVTDRTLRAWGAILAAVPGSRLVMKGGGLGSPALQTAARRRLAAAGLPADSVDLLERTHSQEDHLASYSLVDIALDTFPYNGTTTTCEALWMGVPVVTLAGDRHASRVGASLLRAVGRADWVAADWAGYVRKAAGLAADRAALASGRKSLREEFRRSALFDHAGQSLRFGEALRTMWRAWCATAPAKSESRLSLAGAC